MYKRGQTLPYGRALRSIHLFSLLLEGGQIQAYLTAQAQNAISRIFAFTTYQTHQYSNALVNLRLLLVIELLNTFLVCFLFYSNPKLPCFHFPPAAHEKRCFTCCQWSGCNSMSHHEDTTAFSLWDAGHAISIGWGSLGVSLVTFIMMYFI